MLRFTTVAPLLFVAALAVRPGIAEAAEGVNAVLYVDDDAPPRGSGSSWSDALHDFQAALTVASAPGSGVSEIRIGQGRYVPSLRTDESDPRSATFQLVSGLTVIGGFAGLGAKNPDLQDVEAFETVLTGDLNGDDGPAGTFTNQEDNAYHVVTASGTDANTWLEGVTITAGNACCGFSQSDPRSFGAGVFAQTTNATFALCTFAWNTANRGGGAYLQGGAPLLVDCRFQNNRATLPNGDGGGARIERGHPTFLTCVFLENSARRGGAVHLADGTSSFLDCQFTSNAADGDYGGALYATFASLDLSRCRFASNQAAYGGGAILLLDCPASLSDCDFDDNEAPVGGAVSASNPLNLQRCAFRNNVAINLGNGGGLYLEQGSLDMCDCSFIQNSAGIAGAIEMVNSLPSRIDTSQFIDNTALLRCGAILAGATDSTISRCLFRANEASDAGALGTGASTTILANCLFDHNSAHGIVGSGQGGAILNQAGTLIASNCTFYGNIADSDGGMVYNTVSGVCEFVNVISWMSDPNHAIATPSSVISFTNSCVQDGWLGPGAANIAQDPLFVNASRLAFDLAGLSPCIDAGDNAGVCIGADSDLAGLPRFRDDPNTIDTGFGFGAIVDMGCYEFQPSSPACTEDCSLPPDGLVDLEDLLEVIENWAQVGPEQADVDLNFVVDMDDLLRVIHSWGPCR